LAVLLVHLRLELFVQQLAAQLRQLYPLTQVLVRVVLAAQGLVEI